MTVNATHPDVHVSPAMPSGYVGAIVRRRQGTGTAAYTILYYTVLYYTVLYCTIRYDTILHKPIAGSRSRMATLRRPESPNRQHTSPGINPISIIYIYSRYIDIYLSLSLYIYIYMYTYNTIGSKSVRCLASVNIHPVRIARIRYARFAPRVGLRCKEMCTLSAQIISQGWVRKDTNLRLRTGCTSPGPPIQSRPPPLVG